MNDKPILQLGIFNSGESSESLTSELGVKPTSIRHANVPYIVNRHEIANHDGAWLYESRSTNLDDIGGEIEKFLSLFKLDSPIFKDQKQLTLIELGCYIFTSSPNPGLHISASTIRRLAEATIELDIDIYAT